MNLDELLMYEPLRRAYAAECSLQPTDLISRPRDLHDQLWQSRGWTAMLVSIVACLRRLVERPGELDYFLPRLMYAAESLLYDDEAATDAILPSIADDVAAGFFALNDQFVREYGAACRGFICAGILFERSARGLLASRYAVADCEYRLADMRAVMRAAVMCKPIRPLLTETEVHSVGLPSGLSWTVDPVVSLFCPGEYRAYLRQERWYELEGIGPRAYASFDLFHVLCRLGDAERRQIVVQLLGQAYA